MRELLELARWRRRVPRSKGSAYEAHFKGFWPLVARSRIRPLPRASSGRFTAVLLVHRRQWNADLQVRLALQSPAIGRVVVSNDNPELDVHDVVRARSPRLVLRNDAGRNQTRRFAVAAEDGADRFFLLDDDIFVSSEAITSMCARFEQDMSTPAGIWGQRLIGEAWEHAIQGDRERVDVLNRGYLCTRDQAERVFELTAALGWSEEKTFRSVPCDDVLLSFTGDGPPRVIAADYIDCVSHSEADISSFRQAGFHDARVTAIHELRQLTGIAAGDAGARTEEGS